MKKVFIFYLISSCGNYCYSQIETTPLKPDEVIKVQLKNELADKPISKFIHSLQLIDSRADTTSLGYSYSSFYKKVSKYTFDSSTVDELSDWLRHYLNVGEEKRSADRLMISLKKLRISSEVIPTSFDDNHPGQPMNGWEKGVVIKAEFYLAKDSFYYPLYRYDSIIKIYEELPENAAEYVTTAFKAALIKFFTINLELVQAKARKLTLTDILLHNKRDNEVPILIDNNYKRGGYANFEEFRMNNPSIIDFEFKKGNMGDFLYVKGDGVEYPDRTAWGFCDGKSLFINSSDKFSKLIREGNAFYFEGIKSITRKTKHELLKTSGLNLLENSGQKKTVYKKNMMYYQVDMETGEVY